MDHYRIAQLERYAPQSMAVSPLALYSASQHIDIELRQPLAMAGHRYRISWWMSNSVELWQLLPFRCISFYRGLYRQSWCINSHTAWCYNH